MAFIMHSLSWLATNGTAAIVCFPGIMYRGGKEQKIRKYLVDNNYVDCIIQLPDNLFFGTTIITCIMVLKKSKTSNDILFIDASKEFVKLANNNKLTQENISNIISLYCDRKDVDYVTKVVSNQQIRDMKYKLSVTNYVDQEDNREIVDINSLNEEIHRIVSQENELRDKIDQIIKDIESD